jgi:hypothetical protein
MTTHESECRTVRGMLWEFHTEELPAAAAAAVSEHLSRCRECELHSLEDKSLSTGLRHLPRMSVSPLLATRLRIIASKERQVALYRNNFGGRMREFLLRQRLKIDHLLRPIWVPATGGLLASFFCFATIVSALQIDHRSDGWDDDIPIGFQSEIAIDELSPFSYGGGDVMVQLSVDSKGQVTDFATPTGTSPSHEEMQAIGNLVLYSTFTPAFRFGRPVASKRLFYIRHISVKG